MHKMEEMFGDLPAWLAAENGAYLRPPPGGKVAAAEREPPVRGAARALPLLLLTLPGACVRF